MGNSVFKYNLSTRANHLLHKMQISSVEEFLSTPINAFSMQKGVGKKTIDELVELRKTLAEQDYVCTDVDELNQPTDRGILDGFSFSPDTLDVLSNYPITSLPLSGRCYNGLKRAGIVTLDLLVTKTVEDLQSLRSFGTKSIEEIIEVTREWIVNNHFIMNEEDHQDTEIPDDKKAFYEGLSSSLRKIVSIKAGVLYQKCIENDVNIIIEKNEMSLMSSYDYNILFDRVETIHMGVEEYFKAFYYGDVEYVEEERIVEKIESDFDSDSLKNALIFVMKYGGILDNLDDYYVLKKESLHEYLNKYDGGERGVILLERLDGASLQEIGDNNHLTRERVRQITIKLIKKIPTLKEDYYASVFRYFKFNRELFYTVFPESDRRTYDYLSLKYKKGEADLDRNTVNAYQGLFLSALNSYLDKDETIKWKKQLTRQKIAWRILITHPGTYFDRESFGDTYAAFIKDNELDEKRYSFNPYSINNVFRNSKHVVFNKEGKFRYYENDATALWKVVDVEKYNDSVISAELIFRDYPDAMEEYDVKNGYELFCLLKNSFYETPADKRNNIHVYFRRIPTIILGNGDEKSQIIRFVKEMAPIDYWDFYEAYEERYGLRKETAAANLGTYVEQFYFDGKYIVDLPQLSEEDENVIRLKIHEKPLWSIEGLERLFDETCISSDRDALNKTSLYKMGYLLNTGYAYSREYGNFSECIAKSYFTKDLVDISEIDPDIVRLSIFKSYLYQLRYSLDYIEVAPKLYASKKFLESEYGLTAQHIVRIQDKAAQYYDDKFFNGNSLWPRLCDDPVFSILNGNTWLFTSILRQQSSVYSLSVANAVILSLQKDELSLPKICSWIVDREGMMSLERLTDKINVYFGSTLDKHRLAQKLREQGDEKRLLTDGVDDYIEQLIINSDVNEDNLFREEFY